MSRYTHAHSYRTVQTFEVRIGAVALRIDAWEWRSAATAARKRYADLPGKASPLVRSADVTKLRKSGNAAAPPAEGAIRDA